MEVFLVQFLGLSNAQPFRRRRGKAIPFEGQKVFKKPSSHQGGLSLNPARTRKMPLKAGINIRAFQNARTMIPRPFPPHFPWPFPCLSATGDGTEIECGFGQRHKRLAFSKLCYRQTRTEGDHSPQHRENRKPRWDLRDG